MITRTHEDCLMVQFIKCTVDVFPGGVHLNKLNPVDTKLAITAYPLFLKQFTRSSKLSRASKVKTAVPVYSTCFRCFSISLKRKKLDHSKCCSFKQPQISRGTSFQPMEGPNSPLRVAGQLHAPENRN